ncbi:hypothetical protein PCASD_09510 [Puccinia coronata f. sp. avenae]|uniref:Uncharacterized protein n=1 Tax=Puccinia coronata f. sp. avenae TaxID=200324 RepID=A0A2N5U623_9BASI|nr:hypothetical protein PCASD_09510 [Puccinia coronata f. sp. avenae]
MLGAHSNQSVCSPWSDGSPPAAPFASASAAVYIPVLPASVEQTQISSVATIRTNTMSNGEAVSMTTIAGPDSTTGRKSQPATPSPASEA